MDTNNTNDTIQVAKKDWDDLVKKVNVVLTRMNDIYNRTEHIEDMLCNLNNVSKAAKEGKIKLQYPVPKPTKRNDPSNWSPVLFHTEYL